MVAIVEGAAEFGCDGFRICGEFGDDIGLVEPVCVDEEAAGGDYAAGTIRILRKCASREVDEGPYQKKAMDTETGYSLNSLRALTRKERCRCCKWCMTTVFEGWKIWGCLGRCHCVMGRETPC